MDCVIASMKLKTMKKCQDWLIIPSKSILLPYSRPPASIVGRAPYRSPSHPDIGANIAPVR